MLTLKTILGLVTLTAVVVACVAATLRPPSSTSDFPSGLLFALAVLLCIIAMSRIISAYPEIDGFWTGFLLACGVCAAITFSAPIIAANTAPEHIARYLSQLSPSTNESVFLRNERFHALQRIVNITAMLAFATICGLLASRQRTCLVTKDTGR